MATAKAIRERPSSTPLAKSVAVPRSPKCPSRDEKLPISRPAARTTSPLMSVLLGIDKGLLTEIPFVVN
jgi:hypothetical protein